MVGYIYNTIGRTVTRLPQMRLAVGGWILTITIIGDAPIWAQAIIHLRPTALTEAGSLLRLRHIADITCDESSERERLEQLTLGPVPAAGQVLRWECDEIRQRLQALGVNLAHLEFQGASRVIVTTRNDPQPPQRIQVTSATTADLLPTQRQRVSAHLERALRTAYQWRHPEHQRVVIRCQCQDEDIPTLLAQPVTELLFDAPQLQANSTQKVYVQWRDATGTWQRVPIEVHIEVKELVLAPRRPLPKGAILQAEDLMWVEEQSEGGILRLEEVVGRETSRPLRTGQVLQPQDLVSQPLVRSGEIITVWVRRPGLQVKRICKSQANGALGDTIVVTAVDDPRVRLTATVTGYHEAEVARPINQAKGGGETPPRSQP
ncbi:MAG: hypothetical protein KatS3mg114_0424 [Planctomycetaceae bacterium]|nr:MAG: hypothetical protein KatS3mg114_0424 [Planctomycetaceae bacterium]